MRNITIAALALTSAFALAPASADEQTSHGRQVAVSYSDLNLERPADQAELRARVQRAVFEACGFDGTAPFDEVVRCRRDARAAVMARADARVRQALRGDWNQASGSP